MGGHCAKTSVFMDVRCILPCKLMGLKATSLVLRKFCPSFDFNVRFHIGDASRHRDLCAELL